MSTTTALSLDEQRSRLEGRASVIRLRLLHIVDALDNRRQQVREIGHHAKRLVVPVVGSLLGALVLVAGTALAVRALVERRRERALSYRLAKVIAPLRGEAKPPFWRDARRRITVTVLTILASELAKRSSRALLDGRVFAFLPVHVEGHAKSNDAHEPPLLGK